MTLCRTAWYWPVFYGIVCYFMAFLWFCMLLLWFNMVLTYIDTVEMILSDWHDTDAGGSSVPL